MQSVHFSSNSPEWSTPQYLFDELNAKYGPFSVDVCASAENAKCQIYFNKYDDGLRYEWHQVGHLYGLDLVPRIWMNPPYGRTIGKWIKKAYEQSQMGALVCCLLPARTDTKYFHTYIYKKPNVEIVFLKGRLKFGNAKNSAPFPSMVVVFHPISNGAK